jgi:DNA-binding CsgD family transcriptional regulator
MAAIMTLRGELELWSRVQPLTGDESEVVNVSPDFDTWSGSRERARLRAERGGTKLVRKLFGPGALARESDRRLLREMADQGFQIRITSADLPHGTLFIDRRTMVLSEPGSTPSENRQYVMSSAAALVGGAYALFEAAWAAADELEAFLVSDRPLLDARARAVLKALGSGATDEAASRRLGMSVRTYRRSVAELLAVLGAGSRFQAGVRAGQLGLARD